MTISLSDLKHLTGSEFILKDATMAHKFLHNQAPSYLYNFRVPVMQRTKQDFSGQP